MNGPEDVMMNSKDSTSRVQDLDARSTDGVTILEVANGRPIKLWTDGVPV